MCLDDKQEYFKSRKGRRVSQRMWKKVMNYVFPKTNLKLKFGKGNPDEVQCNGEKNNIRKIKGKQEIGIGMLIFDDKKKAKMKSCSSPEEN